MSQKLKIIRAQSSINLEAYFNTWSKANEVTIISSSLTYESGYILSVIYMEKE